MSRSKDIPILKKLITVKKRKAEQRLAEIQRARQQTEHEAQEIRLSLSQIGTQPGSFDALNIAVRNRFPERMVQELESLKHKHNMLMVEKTTAEHELKVALHAARELHRSDS